jgi:hypothetical protein
MSPMEKRKDQEQGLPMVNECSRIATEESSGTPASQLQSPSHLMDWEKGLVGWDSASDPANPLWAN